MEKKKICIASLMWGLYGVKTHTNLDFVKVAVR